MDRLSDMVARIKNGQSRRRLSVDVLASKFCGTVLDCLAKEGFIRGYSVQDRTFKVYLKYKDNRPVIEEIQRISKPGLRRYYSVKKLRKEFLSNELVIFSCNKGVFMNSALVLKGLNEGGEALIRIK